MKKLFTGFLLLLCFYVSGQQTIIVSPHPTSGKIHTDFTIVSGIDSALLLGSQSAAHEVVIMLRAGNYHLTSPIEIQSSQWKDKKLTITAYPQEKVVLSGSLPLRLDWKKHKNGIWKSKTDQKNFDQLFINGRPAILARYPNYQEDQILNGSSADALSAQRIKKWKSPAGGYIHALHNREWGGLYYRITGKKDGKLQYEGGYQNNRPSAMHKSCIFVENIFEELDQPGEWFLDQQQGMLYYYPYPDQNIQQATVEASQLPELIRITGTEIEPIKNITICNIDCIHTSRTFLNTYEPLLRSDWCIHRGAAIFLEFADNCHILNCNLYHLGGNAIFFSKYNLNCTARSNHIHNIGASAICLVGDTSAVRSGLANYGKSLPYEKLDLTPGPKNNLFPRQCTIKDNLIHHIGRVEKQVAGIQIQLASEIHVRHNTIYSTPRAAINIGDGAFGGHLLEYNDAFRTVLETGDHGTFNSWGRDRFWHPSYSEMCKRVAEHPELILLDACYTTIIRNNRFRCDHGWDIDLDDGSSNYHIYNNLCLHGGIKLREGFYRTVENNIVVNNSLHPHVWFANSGDVIQRNVFLQAYKPIGIQSWGKKIDYNFFTDEKALQEAQNRKTDQHSISGNPQFKDATAGNFSVMPGSPVFKIGFINFPQDRFGVYSPRLKKLACEPEIPHLQYTSGTSSEQKEYLWLKSNVRPVNGPGDRSAFGLPDQKGIIILQVPADSPLKAAGINAGDVIRKLNKHTLNSIDDLLNLTKKYKGFKELEIDYFRNQQVYSTTLQNP